MKVTASSAIASMRVGNLAAGGADAAVVEGDDMVAPGDRIDDARVPVVEVGGEVDEEDDGDPALRPQLAIGVGDAAGGDRACGAFAYDVMTGAFEVLVMLMRVLLVGMALTRLKPSALNYECDQ